MTRFPRDQRALFVVDFKCIIGTADRSQHKSKLSFQTGAIFLSACQTSDYEETDRILSQSDKKIINYANSDGLTALHQASIDGNLQMIKYLVEKGADINVTGRFQVYPVIRKPFIIHEHSCVILLICSKNKK